MENVKENEKDKVNLTLSVEEYVRITYGHAYYQYVYDPQKKLLLVVMQDELPPNPRENEDNLFRLLFTKKSGLGDKHDYSTEELRDLTFLKDDQIVYNVYAYEHGSIGFSLSNNTYPYNDPWDSGQIGVAIADLDSINKWYGWNYSTIQEIPSDKRDIIRDELIDELDVYEAYVNGNVYFYVLSELKDNTFEDIDSCGGFYGTGSDVKKQMAEQLGDASYLLDRLD